MIILILSGLVSLGLSFYEPPPAVGTPTNSTLLANGTLIEDMNKLDERKEEHGSAWIEGVAILVCVVVVVLVTAINDFSKERQFRSKCTRFVVNFIVS